VEERGDAFYTFSLLLCIWFSLWLMRGPHHVLRIFFYSSSPTTVQMHMDIHVARWRHQHAFIAYILDMSCKPGFREYKLRKMSCWIYWSHMDFVKQNRHPKLSKKTNKLKQNLPCQTWNHPSLILSSLVCPQHLVSEWLSDQEPEIGHIR
jgi:hypothetical protein